MELKQAVKVMSALAQESRLAVFRLLVSCGADGMSAGDIAQHLEVPAATLSFHLKELHNAGLIEQERQGRSLIYRLNVEAMRALFAYLMEDCCQGRPEFCGSQEDAGCAGARRPKRGAAKRERR